MSSGDRRFVTHGGSGAPRLSVYQAWWAMDGLGTGDGEWTAEEKLDRIADAGYEGVLVFDDLQGPAGDAWKEQLQQRSLELAVGTIVATPDELRRDIARANDLGAVFVNAQTMDYFLPDEAAVATLAAAVDAGREAGVPCLVETHRACVTQDLLRTVDYVARMPEMLLAIDLSHYVVAGQVPLMPQEIWPIRPELEDCFDALLARTACFHGRVSNGHQAQVDIGPDGDHPAARHFLRWWGAGMRHWLGRAGAGDVLPFVCELGPPPYSIVHHAGAARGSELSDRWEQALVLKRLAERTWEEALATAPSVESTLNSESEM